MPPRLKKFIGTVLLLVLVLIYPLFVMAFAMRILPDAGPVTQLAFYVVAGLFWVLPAGLIVTWMHGGRKAARS